MMAADPAVPPPSLRLRLDHDALAANWRALDSRSRPGRAGAAVKADAYGLGAAAVVPTLHRAGAQDFFVAHWAEAEVIRHLVPPGQIAVLHGPMNADAAAYARATGVTPVINSLHQAEVWRAAGGGRCHLMVDTGINRLGLPLAALGAADIARLEIDILLSHLACAEDDAAQNQTQLARWNAARAAIPHHRASLANSAGIALGADFLGHLTRPGLALYGGASGASLRGVVRQVAYLQAMLLQRRTLAAGDAVGYNATFIAPHDMAVGAVSLGYADGYLRAWGNGVGALRHAGRRLPVLGRVSMDLVVVDLGAAPDCREGDWVDIDYDLALGAAATGLSQYELLTLLGARFVR